jgi:enoyl-CoA hydratase
MCEIMTAALMGWRGDPAVETVLIDHQGARGFCAGGDIRMLAESAAKDGDAARRFFATEYRLNHLLSVYEKPIVVAMDGVTMGGGVGLALPARYRIATERTRFAMPETGIGLFPDVGGGWWLPRLPGHAGLWVVLTGARLATADCLRLGIATHCVDSSALEVLRRALARPGADVGAVLGACASDPGPAPIEAPLPYIDGIFGRESLEAIVAALEADGGEWAKGQLAAMAPKCPASAKVSFRLLTQERPASLAEDLMTEYRLASHLVMRPDFLEGVRAVIVEKDNRPVWRPSGLAEMTDALVDGIFSPLPPGEEWTPLEAVGG